jgi:nucleoside-diphosphate-sugar epimerase
MTDKALAARLRKLAQAYRSVVVVDVTSINEATDLERAADLIERMAQRIPLSDDEINALIEEKEPYSVLAIARIVEQAHGIRSEK